MFLNELLQVNAAVELIRLRARIADVAFGIESLGNLIGLASHRLIGLEQGGGIYIPA